MLFGYGAERRETPSPGIGDQDINVSFLFFYPSIETIEIGQISDVALNAGDIAADFPDGLFQFFLAAARNENIGAFRDKPFRRGEAEAAGSADDRADELYLFADIGAAEGQRTPYHHMQSVEFGVTSARTAESKRRRPRWNR